MKVNAHSRTTANPLLPSFVILDFLFSARNICCNLIKVSDLTAYDSKNVMVAPSIGNAANNGVMNYKK